MPAPPEAEAAEVADRKPRMMAYQVAMLTEVRSAGLARTCRRAGRTSFVDPV